MRVAQAKYLGFTIAEGETSIGRGMRQSNLKGRVNDDGGTRGENESMSQTAYRSTRDCSSYRSTGYSIGATMTMRIQANSRLGAPPSPEQ